MKENSQNHSKTKNKNIILPPEPEGQYKEL